jgi:hypothetical protein
VKRYMPQGSLQHYGKQVVRSSCNSEMMRNKAKCDGFESERNEKILWFIRFDIPLLCIDFFTANRYINVCQRMTRSRFCG